MDRRTYLQGAGALGFSLGWRSRRLDADTAPIEVKIWLTDRASGYRGCKWIIADYLERFLGQAGLDLEVAHAGSTVSVETESAAKLGRWV